MTEGAVRAVQGINVSLCCQSAGAGKTQIRCIAGMAISARAVYNPVVMNRVSRMLCGTVLMAGITCQVHIGLAIP